MRALSWIALGCVVLACGGSAFTSSDGGSNGQGGSGADDSGGDAGLSSGGKVGTGGTLGSGGKIATGGTLSSGGNVIGNGGSGVAGDLVVGGTFPMAGEPGVAGTGPDPQPKDEVCPEDMPDGSRLCAAGLSCSYGEDVRSSCRQRAKCEEGKWSISQVDCPELQACPNIVQGAECDSNSMPCTIEGYIYCVCTGCGAGGPCSTETVWKCSAGSGSQACPHILPNEGQPCAGGLSCPYGSCITDGPVTATCNGATWGWETQQCPQ